MVIQLLALLYVLWLLWCLSQHVRPGVAPFTELSLAQVATGNRAATWLSL